MNLQIPTGSLQPQASSLQTPDSQASRSDKTSQFFGQVLPLSIGLGAQALEGAAIAEAAAGSAATAAGSVAFGATIAGGIVGLTNLALTWGKSTPVAGAASGAGAGAAIGTLIAPGVGTAIGAAIGTIAGGLLGCIKTGKHKDQIVRDKVRAALVERGILSQDYTITLANGSKYDIGIDGGPKAEFGGRRPYEVDFNNPLAKYAVSWLNPLLALISGGNQKVQIDFVGYFANAALSNAKSLADVRDNVNAIMKQFGVTDEALYKTVVAAVNNGQLDSQTAAAWVNGINERHAVKLPNGEPSAAGAPR